MQSLQGGLAGLAVHGLEPGWKENLKPYKNKGQILYFSSYHDGVNYQKRKPSGTDDLCSASCGQGKRTSILQRNFWGDKSSPSLFNRKK